MNIRMLTLTTAMIAGLGGAVASGGTLDLDAVSADATWLVHVDMERFIDSKIGRFLEEHGDDLDVDMGDIEEMQELLQLDPLRDVKSVTVYGAEEDGDDGVMVLVTSDQIRRALRNLAELEGVEHEVIDVGRYEAHVYRWDGEEHFVHVRGTRGGNRNVVVLADDTRDLAAACRVLDGRSKSLARAESPLADAKPRRGSIVYIAASAVEMFEDVQGASEIAKLTDAVVVDIGENDGDMFAYATVSAENANDARDIVQVLQGMIALGRLVVGEDEDLAPVRDVIRGIDIDARGNQIMVGIRLPTAELLETLEAMDQWDDDHDADHEDEAHDDHEDDDGFRTRRRHEERKRRR